MLCEKKYPGTNQIHPQVACGPANLQKRSPETLELHITKSLMEAEDSIS
jgi:hypothetical protein